MFKIYEHTIPGTNIHLIVAFIILIEILIAFYNIILYLSRPNDKSRLRYLILTILFIQYNISGGLVIDERLPISVLVQGSIGILSSLLMSAYLPYYIYKNLNLRAIRFFAYYGSILFILLPYLFAFLIPLIIYKDYMFACRLYIVVPVLYAFPFVYYVTKAIINENRKNKLTKRHKEQLYGTYLAMLFWILMPVVFFFNGDQISEHVVANTGYLIMSVIFIRASIMDSRDEYYRLIISEKELLKINKTLEVKVLQRTKDLEQANKQRTNTVIGLAHETRTPITLIKNNLEEYVTKYGKSKEIESVKYNIDKLHQNISKILNIEKSSNGFSTYEHNKIINLSDFISDTVKLFKPSASKKGIRLSCHVQSEIYIQISTDALDSLLYNLIDNAIKYTDFNGTVKISLKAIDSIITISVKDNGLGIAPELQQKVFEPYFHIPKNNMSYQGLGIGLSIVKNVVSSLNGGEIILISEPNTGSEFVVKLKQYTQQYPIIPDEYQVTHLKTDIHNQEIEDSIIHDKSSVLIIEDNPQLLVYLRDKLKENYSIYVASDGFKALDKINTYPVKPDLIISDVMMDSMDGLEFYEQLKKIDYGYIPIIYITAKANSTDRDKALKMGALDYIYKPFEISEVRYKIASIIEHAQKQQMAAIDNVKKLLDYFPKKLPDNITTQDNFEINCSFFKISNREKDIIKLAIKGRTYKEIADLLSISRKTVDNHFQNIFRKADVNRLQDLLYKLNK